MEKPSFGTIAWTLDEDTAIGRIELDRPDSLNAMSDRLLSDLQEGFTAFERADDEADGVGVHAVIVEGGGERSFSVGADLTEIYEEDRRFPGTTGRGNETNRVIETFPAPVIAKIDGYCLGGGLELAMACDFRIASEESEFGQPEVGLGLFPGSGAIYRLPALVGESRAKELMMTGESISASEAHVDGIVDRVCPAATLEEEVQSFLDRIVEQPPLAVRAVKDVVDASDEIPYPQIEEYAACRYRKLLETRDHTRALEVHFEDRDRAEWQGR